MASTIIIKNGTSGAPGSLSAGEFAINTTDGGFYYGSTGGTSVSSSFKFGALTSSTFTTTGDVVIGGSVGATAYNSTTSATGFKLNGVKFLWRDGGADLQVGNTSHVTDIIGTNITITPTAGNTITLDGTMVIDAGVLTGATSITSTAFVGNITGNVNVSGGTLTTSAAQNLAIAQGAASNIDIGAYELRAQTLVSDIVDEGTAPMTITSTTVVPNLNADKLDGADLIDEDAMGSNSATAVPTQQSVKAYVDTQDAKQHLVLASHAFGIPRSSTGGDLTGDYVQGNTTWGWADRAWVGNYGTTPDTGFDPTHIMNGILVPYGVTNIKAEVRLQSNKGAADNSYSGSFWLFKHPHTGSAVSNTTVNLIAIGMNHVKYTVNAETAYPPFTVSSSKLVTQYTGDDNAISASAGDMIFPFYKEHTGGNSSGHARGVFIITAEKA